MSDNIKTYINESYSDDIFHSGVSILQNSESNPNPSSLLLGTPRLAKDENYASAVLNAWKSDVSTRPVDGPTSIAAPTIYHDANGFPLYGYVYRPSKFQKPDSNLPGIILFHTGAGPQDVFLRWKADALVSDSETFPDGAVVLIADILGDETGWAWDTDRSRYESVASDVLVPDENGERIVLQSRVRAALDLLRAQPNVDPDRIGVVGFCLGGHPILELGRMCDDSVKAMVSFHGVFGSVHKMKVTFANDDCDDKKDVDKECSVLICTGKNDPFAPEADIGAAKTMFERFGHHVKIITYENTKHGFTNPGQAYNTNPAFDYNEKAYSFAWEELRSLLKNVLKSKSSTK